MVRFYLKTKSSLRILLARSLLNGFVNSLKRLSHLQDHPPKTSMNPVLVTCPRAGLALIFTTTV